MKGHAMNALQQYIDLYRDHGRLLREKSCETLNAPREKACTDLQDMALPRKGSENYEHTDLQELLAPDYALNIARVPLGVNPQATFRCPQPVHVPFHAPQRRMGRNRHLQAQPP